MKCKLVLASALVIITSYILIILFKPNANINFETKDHIKYEEIGSTLFEDISLTSAGVFLYTNNYKDRYLFSANTEIVNPVANVDQDPFFSTLLEYNKQDICTVVRTSELPVESNLYTALNSKDLINTNLFYMACPIYTDGGNLAGYLSDVFENNSNGVVIQLQKLRYYTRLVQENLQGIL